MSDFWSLVKPIVVFVVVLTLGISVAVAIADKLPNNVKVASEFLLGGVAGAMAFVAAVILAD